MFAVVGDKTCYHISTGIQLVVCRRRLSLQIKDPDFQKMEALILVIVAGVHLRTSVV